MLTCWLIIYCFIILLLFVFFFFLLFFTAHVYTFLVETLRHSRRLCLRLDFLTLLSARKDRGKTTHLITHFRIYRRRTRLGTSVSDTFGESLLPLFDNKISVMKSFRGAHRCRAALVALTSRTVALRCSWAGQTTTSKGTPYSGRSPVAVPTPRPRPSAAPLTRLKVLPNSRGHKDSASGPPTLTPSRVSRALENRQGKRVVRKVRRVKKRVAAAVAPASASDTLNADATAPGKTSIRSIGHHFALVTLKHKLENFAHSFSLRFYEWRMLPSRRALEQLVEELEQAVKSNRFDELSRVCHRVEAQRRDPATPSLIRPPLLLLHARALVNFGVFRLVNYETQSAVHLLQEAIDILLAFTREDVESVRDALEAHSAERQAKPKKGAAAEAAARPQNGTAGAHPYFSPETSVLYLRILLANALACEHQFWEATTQLQEVSRVLRSFAIMPLVQIAPGTRGGYHILQRSFINEEQALFYKNTKGVAQAISQGQAKLLLSSAAGVAQRQAVLLQLARLHRRANQYAQSQELYETYLEALVKEGDEDAQCAMLELGQMLLYSMKKLDVGLVYVQAAADILVDDAGLALEEQKITSVAACAAARAAGALLDLSYALQVNKKGDEALQVLDQCLRIFERAGLKRHSVWALKHSADLLCSASQIDKALVNYSHGIDLLNTYQDAEGGAVPQIAGQEQMVRMKVAEIEGHLGYCFQMYVRDYQRALKHYYRALGVTPEQLATGEKFSAPSSSELRSSGKGRSMTVNLWRKRGDDVAPATKDELSPDATHWVLGHIVDCYKRLRNWEAAVGHQKLLLHLEAAVGVPQTDSYLKLADLLQRSGDVEKQLALFFYLFFLPDHALSPAARVVVAQRFGRCCYQMGASKMGAVLLQAVHNAQGSQDPVTLVEYALCVKHVDRESDEMQRASENLLPDDLDRLSKLFTRAASLVVAHRKVEDSDKVQRSAAQELDAVMVLNRGAFFFLEIDQTERAMELYRVTLSYCEEAETSGCHLTASYLREWSIALANTASLEANQPGRTSEALRLFQKACEVSPTNLEVLNSAATFCHNMGYFDDACSILTKALRLPAEDVAYASHLLMAQVGGNLFLKADLPTKFLIMERMAIILGVPADQLLSNIKGMQGGCYADSITTEGQLQQAIQAMEPILESGVGCTLSGEAANLTCCLMQAQHYNPRLLNRLFRIAITRFPMNMQLLYNYANFCSAHQFHDLARKYFARSLAIQESTSTIIGYNFYLEHSFFAEQQAGNREQLLRGFAERHPTDASAWCHYALLLSRTFPSPHKTEATFEAALRLNPQAMLTLCYYGEFLSQSLDSFRATRDLSFRVQQLDRVEQLLLRGVEAAPQMSNTHVYLGMLYASTNRVEGALRAFETAISLDPRNVEALRYAAPLLKSECERMKHKFLAASERSRSTTVDRYPLQLQERMAQTIEVYEQLLVLDPHHTATLEEYAQFCVGVLNDSQKAKELWIQANQSKWKL